MEPSTRLSPPLPVGRARATPPGEVTEADVAALIAQAAATLDAADMAAVHAVLSRDAELLIRGTLPARPRGRLREGRPPLSPAGRAFLRPIRIGLAEVSRRPGVTAAELVALGERLRGYVSSPLAVPSDEAAAD